jgi:hypothetical protein
VTTSLLLCQFLLSTVLYCNHNLSFRLRNLRITTEDIKWRMIVGCAELRTVVYFSLCCLVHLCVFFLKKMGENVFKGKRCTFLGDQLRHTGS